MGFFSLFSSSKNPEQEFFEQCEITIKFLVSSVAGLASSVDSIQVATKILLNELESVVSDVEDVEKRQTSLKLTKDLLRNIEFSLENQKISSLESISMFLDKLTKQEENKKVMAKYMPNLESLSIDEFMDSYRKRTESQAEFVQNAQADSSVDPEMSKENLKGQIKQLQAENDILKSENEAKLTEAAEKIQERDKKIAKLHVEMKQLKTELETLQHRVETIPVQLYCQRSGDLMSHIEQDLLRKLDETFGKYTKELEVTKCETSSEIQPNVPLLLVCISTSRLGTDAANTIQGVIQKENTALLIFHHKDEHALPTQASDRVLTGPDFKALRRIYDLAFLSGKGIYDCDMNSYGITSLIDFICRVTIENFSADITVPVNESRQVLSR